MQEERFLEWLQGQNYDPRTLSTQKSYVRRLSEAYGSLDVLYDGDQFGSLLDELSYTKDDERRNRPNPTKISIDGKIYNNLSSYRSTLRYYARFRQSEARGQTLSVAEQKALIGRLTRADVESSMNECDDLGLENFLKIYGFKKSRRWIVRDNTENLYPPKAVIASAIQRLEDGNLLDSSSFFKGQGEAESFANMEQLGFMLTSSPQEDRVSNAFFDQLSRDDILAAMEEYDTLGVSAFHDKYRKYGWGKAKKTLPQHFPPIGGKVRQL